MAEWKYQPAADTGLTPAERFRSVRREPGLASGLAHGSLILALRAYLKTYHRLRIVGAEHLPRAAPFVVIANHASHLDALILAAALPRRARLCAYPVAAGDVFFESAPISAFSALFINALPLWRKRVTAHALDELRARLEEGRTGYILFPEGARTRDGNLLPFKPGLGRLVTGTAVPVVPCYLEGAFRALPPDKKLPRPIKLTLHAAPPLSFAATPNTREGWNEVAKRLEEAVRGLELMRKIP